MLKRDDFSVSLNFLPLLNIRTIEVVLHFLVHNSAQLVAKAYATVPIVLHLPFLSKQNILRNPYDEFLPQNSF